jgi:CheY-like chemotaxis protein
MLANQLVVAHDGAEAISLLTGEGAHDFAFVMLDLKLPKFGGFEVLERIRANPTTRTLPVVILTSSSQQEDMITSYRDGANSYVRKPVDFEEFASAVAALGLYWSVINEKPDVMLAVTQDPDPGLVHP